MPKYLIHGSYTEQGLKGLLKEGGSKRREATEQALKAIGGTLEAYYFAFGDNDYYVIADLPDNVNATTVALVANASGAIKNKTTVLITPEEVDQAVENLTSLIAVHARIFGCDHRWHGGSDVSSDIQNGRCYQRLIRARCISETISSFGVQNASAGLHKFKDSARVLSRNYFLTD